MARAAAAKNDEDKAQDQGALEAAEADKRAEEAKAEESKEDAHEDHGVLDAAGAPQAQFDVSPGLAAPPIDLGQLSAARAVFDTSGTAGAADHDIRRASAAFDELAEARDEVPAHLEKYLESDEGYKKIKEREADRRADA